MVVLDVVLIATRKGEMHKEMGSQPSGGFASLPIYIIFFSKFCRNTNALPYKALII